MLEAEQRGGRLLSVTEPHSPGSPMCDLGDKRPIEEYNSFKTPLELWWGRTTCILKNTLKRLQSANRSTLNLVLPGKSTSVNKFRKHSIWPLNETVTKIY